MTRRLIAALAGLSVLTFIVVWAVVHYSFIYIGGRGFDIVDMVEKPVRVPVGDAERIHMALHMVYGDLKLAPGTDALLAGSTRYNAREFAPHVLYEEDGKQGRLLIDHLMNADNTRLINRTGRVNEWRLAINDQLPIDELEVVVALGSAAVNLRGVDLGHGKLDLIAGDFMVDLRGIWAQDSTVEIAGLTGVITVTLPSETGTVVAIEDGPGELHVTGLAELNAAPPTFLTPAAQEEQLDNPSDAETMRYYANSAYGQSSPTLTVQISPAFSTLNLRVDQGE